MNVIVRASNTHGVIGVRIGLALKIALVVHDATKPFVSTATIVCVPAIDVESVNAFAHVAKNVKSPYAIFVVVGVRTKKVDASNAKRVIFVKGTSALPVRGVFATRHFVCVMKSDLNLNNKGD